MRAETNTLRIISEMVAEPVLPDYKEDGMAVLAKEKERLTGLLKTLRDRITEIKNEYPYTMKPIIHSEKTIAEKKAELEDTISQLNEALEMYKRRVAEMLR